MASKLSAELQQAKRYLGIAETVDTNPRQARKDAYRGAAEAIAAHIDRTGDTQKFIAMNLGVAVGAVSTLLKWRREGYKADTPYLMDPKATSRARVSHSKAVLRDPVERQQVIQSLTPQERGAIVRDAIEGSPSVAAVAREAASSEAEREFRARRAESSRELHSKPIQAARLGFARKVIEYTDGLRFMADEFGDMTEMQCSQVLDAHEALEKRVQINIIKLRQRLGLEAEDVIEGRESAPVRELEWQGD